MAVYCTRCGTPNEDQAAFCKQCGAALVKASGPPGATATGPAPTPAPYPSMPVPVAYAGFWRRFAAITIDGIIILIAIYGLFLGDSMFHLERGYAIGGVPVLGLLIDAGVWLYFTLMESSSKQGTLGKIALRIIVTNMDGKRISFGKANGRFFGKIMSAIIVYGGFFMIAWTERKQGLHDMVAGTLVVQK